MIEYLSKGQVTVDELRNLYQSVGWTSYTQDSTILEKTLEGSRHYIIARSEGRLVGLVRSVGDGVFIAYIQDLLVHPDYHRQGIGTQLMGLIFEEVSYAKQILLTTDDDDSTKEFYESVGMKTYQEFGTIGYAMYNL